MPSITSLLAAAALLCVTGAASDDRASPLPDAAFPRTLELDLVFPRQSVTYRPAAAFPVIWAARNAHLADGLGIRVSQSLSNHTSRRQYRGRGPVVDLPVEPARLYPGDAFRNATSSPDAYFFFAYAHNVTVRDGQETSGYQLSWAIDYASCHGPRVDPVPGRAEGKIDFYIEANGTGVPDGIPLAADVDTPGCAPYAGGFDAVSPHLALDVRGGLDAAWEDGDGRAHDACYNATRLPWLWGLCPVTVDRDTAADLAARVCARAGLEEGCFADSAAAPRASAVAVALGAALAVYHLVV